MNSLLARCRIGCQIAILGLIGIVGVLLVAGIDSWGTSQTGLANAKAMAAEQSRDLERNAQIALLQARRHEKDFLLRREEAVVSRHAEAMTAATQALDSLIATVSLNPEMLGLTQQMILDSRQYAATFAKVVQRARVIGLTEDQGLLGNLRVSVHDVEQKLAAIDVPAAQISMLMMRRHEKDFIARVDPKYPVALKAELPKFIAAIQASDTPAGVSQELLAKMQAYQLTFGEFQSAVIEQAAALQSLSKVYAAIEPRLTEADRRFREQADAARNDADTISESTRRLMLIALGAIVASMSGLCWIVGRGIAKPVVAVTRAMDALVKGDLTTAIPSDKRRDEIGTMIGVVGILKDSLLEAAQMRKEREAANQIAEQQKSAALIAMAQQIETETGGAVSIICGRAATMTETVERMRALSAHTGLSANTAAAAAEVALGNAQTVASAAEQLSASVYEISGQVAQSTRVVTLAVEAGQNARITIEALNERVGRIGAVANIIADIAARTNLLALNATIEAARAGDAGKGFAVVAGEVKQLANQTAQSTQEITRHVNDVRAATEAAVSAVHRIESTIAEVNQIAGSIAAAVEQQGSATAEIARNVSGTASAINEMTSLNLEVSNEAEQAGQYAEDVLANSGLLATAMEGLQKMLIRTVRQSAAEVNRRLDVRHDTDLTCRLEIAGNVPADARMSDISVGGARIVGAGKLSPGTRGTVVVDAMNVRLAFTVEASGQREARLSFVRDEATQAIVRSVVERLPQSLAA